jgi:hypothetical protein
MTEKSEMNTRTYHVVSAHTGMRFSEGAEYYRILNDADGHHGLVAFSTPQQAHEYLKNQEARLARELNERTGEEVRRFIVSYMRAHEVARLAREHGVDYLLDGDPQVGAADVPYEGCFGDIPSAAPVSELEQPVDSEDRHDEGPGFHDEPPSG